VIHKPALSMTVSFNDHVSLQPCALVQVGKYKPAQKAAVVAYRGAQFFGVSFVASVFGHSLTKHMVSLSSVLSQGTIVLLGMLATTMAVVRFVHSATVQFLPFVKPLRSATSRHWWDR